MLQAFDVSAAVFVRGLTNLKTVLAKGEAHGTEVTASLVEGMQDLAAQVQLHDQRLLFQEAEDLRLRLIDSSVEAHLRAIYPRDVRSDDGAMKLERALLLACVTVTGCSLKDMLAKADDAGPAGAADSGTTVSTASAAAAAPAAASDAGGVGVAVAKNAVTDAGAVKAKGVPTCAKGQVMATVAMSPFKAFCGAPCKTDADCHGQLCEDVNSLGPDGNRAKSGPEFIKVCDPETSLSVATGPGGSRASASASASAAPPATAKKCGPNQHFDDIDKKCRAFGDCPKGFRWNDPMKSCIDDG